MASSKNAVVTGAGSGVGRATALLLAEKGWRVALVGRRSEALRSTAGERKNLAGQFEIFECDVSDAEKVNLLARDVVAKLGPISVLVNAAGTNLPDRSLEKLTVENYRLILRTNLDGAFHCLHAFLPQMRRQRGGTIVNIISDAGKQASPKSGSAYVASKFGLAGLTQSINAEEREHGIRACGIFPGDIDTPLLDRRPAPPTAAAREVMLKPEDIAECVLLVVQLPPRAVVEEILIRPG